MNYLITGSSGFIGFHLSLKLLKNNHKVIGIDNLNKYYDLSLKKRRNVQLKSFKNYSFYKVDITKKSKIDKIFKKEKIDVVVHLAAQAGVRYSIVNPSIYAKTNFIGFHNIIQNCVDHKIKKFIFASSSSIYGSSSKSKFKENFFTDKPLQLYAATTKSNELVAHAYSSLYNLKCIGLRFFTVYGPWGRPDMSLFKFVKNILNNRYIEIYNNGNHFRDFTYIDDCVSGIIKCLKFKMRKNFEIFNIASEKPIKLINFIKLIEKSLKIKSKKKFMELQKGDTVRTSASIKKISRLTGYKPRTTIQIGVKKFVEWYKNYNK